MDFSINKIEATKNKKINFKGLEGAYNVKSIPVFKFIAPPHSKNEEVHLEFVFLHPDETTGGYHEPDLKNVNTLPFKEDDTIQISQKKFRDISSGFAYRYKIVDKNNPSKVRYDVDSFRTIEAKDGSIMNVIEQGNFYGISPKGGTMRHSFLDSDVVLNESQTGIEYKKDFVRNHFNKLGGNIKGLTWLLKNTDELDNYTYFMTTPDIGMDKVSSHRYWPSNQYQCSDLDNFKEFNFELFKRGKSYVADGAFTSQGLQSPLVQHVLKWGKQSPYYNMLKIDPNSALSLGVLPDIDTPDGQEAYKHIGVRVINKKNSPDYDRKKPTYIQFYDDRLLSTKKQIDGKLHFDYDSTPDDHYEITTHQDSVQPYAFEVDPNDSRMRMFKNQNAVLLTEIDDVDAFLTFSNFKIDSKNKVGGATYWDGNVDIIKMNLSNPNKQDPKNVQGYRDARDYLLGVASYWTETVQSHLILETAKMDEKNIKDVALANGVTPERFDGIKKTLSAFNSIVTGEKQKHTLDYILEFPLQSLETSEELSAIFAQKEFKKELLTPQMLDRLTKIFNDTINGAIPEQYKDNKEYRAYVEKTYGNEILRHIFASALDTRAIVSGKIDLNVLKDVTLKSIETHPSNSPKDEISQVVAKIKSGMSEKSTAALQKTMKEELKNISLDKFKLAEAVVLQGKGGLNWRFDAAKDIGDLDAVRDKTAKLTDIFNGEMRYPGVQDFWGEYIKNIRKYHPAPYIINELTAMGEFAPIGDDIKDNPEAVLQVYRDYDEQMAQAWVKAGRPDEYEKKPVYSKQVDFLNKTNSTTTSEYSKGFNAFSVFAGVDPEHEMDPNKFASTKKKAGDLYKLKKCMEELMIYNQPNSAIYSHMFTNNHDKPTIIHTLPLNMSVFMAKDLEQLDEDTKKQIQDLTGEKNLKKVCPQAAGVGLAMKKTIDELYSGEKNKATREKLYTSLRNLVNGKKTPTSQPSYKRAESFGVKPYEVTIVDLLKGADMYSEDNFLKFHGTMLHDSMAYYERLWQVMNACVGIPTLYGGAEFAQSGYETSSKNVYLGCRNQILHNLKEDKKYGHKEYYDKMAQTSSLYQKPGLKALRNGAPISCQMIDEAASIRKEISELYQQQAKKNNINEGALKYFIGQIEAYFAQKDALTSEELFQKLESIKSDKKALSEFLEKTLSISTDNKNHEVFASAIDAIEETLKMKKELNKELENADKTQIWPVFKKDGKASQTLSIVTNLGLPYGKASFEETQQAQKPISYMVKDGKIEIKDSKGRCPMVIPDGYELRRFGSDEVYEIVDGALKPKNGKNFYLNDTVTTFYLALKPLRTA